MFFAQELFLSSDVQRGARGSCCCCCFLTTKLWRLVFWGFFCFTGVSTSVSDHMDQRPRWWRGGGGLAQTSLSAANTLHPSTLAAHILFTLCSGRSPSKHITRAAITLWKKRDSATTDTRLATCTCCHTWAKRAVSGLWLSAPRTAHCHFLSFLRFSSTRHRETLTSR